MKLLLIICLIIIYLLYILFKKPKNQIPKIIIQTWKDNNIPEKLKMYQDTIKKYNPEYKYLFFTDIDINNFIQKEYPQYWDKFNGFPQKIQKIDFFRYLAVYHYGGFYMDMDMICLKNFDELLHYSLVFPAEFIMHDRRCNYWIRHKRTFYDCTKTDVQYGQYAFAAKPKHPFLKLLIDNTTYNVNTTNKEYKIYFTTGPDFVTKQFINNPQNVKILYNGIKPHYFGDYAKHTFYGSWKKS